MTMRTTISYGITRDEDRLVIVRASRIRSGISYDPQWNGPVQEDRADWKNLIGRMYAEVWDGQAVTAVCVPVDKSIFRPLSTPFVSRKKAHRVLPSLLDIQLPFPLEESLCCFVDEPAERSAPVSSLAVTVRSDEYDEFLSTWQELGIDPVVVDHEGLAWWTWYQKKIPPTAPEARLIVAFGQTRSVIVAGSGSRILGCYRWNKGVQHFSQRHEAWTDAVNRLQRICLAHKEEFKDRPVRMIETGGALPPSIYESFESQWEREEAQPECIRDSDGGLALASALAERSLLADKLPCNIRRSAVAHPAEMQAVERTVKKMFVFVMLLGLLLAVVAAGWRGYLYSRESKIRNDVAVLASALTNMKSVPKGQEVLLAERALKSRKAELRPFSIAVNDSVTGLLNDVLETAGKTGVKMNRLVIRTDGILIRGTSAGWNDCEAFIPLLQRAGYRTSAPERQDAGMDERVHFQLQGALP